MAISETKHSGVNTCKCQETIQQLCIKKHKVLIDETYYSTQLNAKNGCKCNVPLYPYLKCKVHTILIYSNVTLERSAAGSS